MQKKYFHWAIDELTLSKFLNKFSEEMRKGNYDNWKIEQINFMDTPDYVTKKSISIKISHE